MTQYSYSLASHQICTLRRQFAQTSGLPFSDLLSVEHVERVLEEEKVLFRDRLFSPLITIWIFLSQVLSPDHCCREAVASRPVGISMPDTPDNQMEYPQQKRQAPGVGFPLARLVALISLSCGAVLDLAIAPYHGKEKSETAIFRSLWGRLQPGDVALGDRFYGSYFHIALLGDLNAFRDILLFAKPKQLAELCRHLLTAIASHRVGNRPDRLEPRARKRRAKNYPLLQIPRQQAKRQLNQRTLSCA